MLWRLSFLCIILQLLFNFGDGFVRPSTLSRQLQTDRPIISIPARGTLYKGSSSTITSHIYMQSFEAYDAAMKEKVDSGGSAGVEIAIEYLNSPRAEKLMSKLALTNKALDDEAKKLNFWTGGNFVVKKVTCTGILPTGLRLSAECEVKGKQETREVVCKFPTEVTDEEKLKIVLVQMASSVDRIKDTGDILLLPFGKDFTMPLDFKFNNVPHATWVRQYLYDAAAQATVKAVKDPTIPDKSRLMMQVNFPEVNPAFDTYRIGTMLEMVRKMALELTEKERLKVRICVQQSLGEGIFTGLPLAIGAMRPILERMDWGLNLSEEEKFQMGDTESPRPEALLRLGTVGADQVAADDDVFIIIAPQNVIGAMVIELLEDMVKAANGRPCILVNPLLADRPSSNNMMQLRGRSERRAFADSFKYIFQFRLLYPSSGGYMFPIRGLISKRDYHSPWVAYSKEEISTEAAESEFVFSGGGAGLLAGKSGAAALGGAAKVASETAARRSGTAATKEYYRMIAGFDSYQPPDPTLLSNVFLQD